MVFRHHTGAGHGHAREHGDGGLQHHGDEAVQPAGEGNVPSPIDVQKALKGMDYPASKVAIVQCAERAHADRRVIDALKRMSDREYGSPASVSKELGRLM
ncbi:DUF2795 domain-containing protein [Burkholderia multivorans]